MNKKTVAYLDAHNERPTQKSGSGPAAKGSGPAADIAVVAASMEAQGATNSQMYIRAKALAEGKSDPMSTSFPAAPFSISAV